MPIQYSLKIVDLLFFFQSKSFQEKMLGFLLLLLVGFLGGFFVCFSSVVKIKIKDPFGSKGEIFNAWYFGRDSALIPDSSGNKWTSHELR